MRKLVNVLIINEEMGEFRFVQGEWTSSKGESRAAPSRGEVLITRLQDDGLIYGLILTDDAVAAVLLAAIVLDKSLFFEFRQTTVHCGLRIGGVGDEFHGTATGMLPDVVKYGVKFIFRRDRQVFLFLFLVAVCPYDIHELLFSKQIFLNGGAGLRVFSAVQLKFKGYICPRHGLHDQRFSVAGVDVMERDNNGG